MRSHLAPNNPGGLRWVSVGCGPHHLRAAWWNTDLRSFEGIDQSMDATQPWPWTACLDLIYAEHFIEHLEIGAALDFLASASDALAPGGHIRLTTPSLEWVLKTHFPFGNEEAEDGIGDTLRLNRAFYGWGHRFLYSQPVLRQVVESAGFGNVRFCDYHASDVPAFRKLELHGDYSFDAGYPSVWIIEGTKMSSTVDGSLPLRRQIAADYGQYCLAGH